MNSEKIKTYLKVNLCFSLIAILAFILLFVNVGVRKTNDNGFYNILITCLVIYFIGYLVNLIYSILLYTKNKELCDNNLPFKLTIWFSFFIVTNMFSSVTSTICLVHNKSNPI